jgi:hypothetical protein
VTAEAHIASQAKMHDQLLAKEIGLTKFTCSFFLENAGELRFFVL